jgi:hypothetical protein
MRKSVGQAATAAEQTQQKPCRTSSDIGAELENHSRTRSDVGSERVNIAQCPCNFTTYIKFNTNLLQVFLFVNYLTSSLKMANR